MSRQQARRSWVVIEVSLRSKVRLLGNLSQVLQNWPFKL